jgi:hypothetical protein
VRAAAALAIAGLAASVAATTHAAVRAACPGPPPARVDAAHGFELDVQNAAGYVVDATGRFQALIPGVHVDRFSGAAGALQQLTIDPGETNGYIVWMKAGRGWPARFVLTRRTTGGADAAATWFVPRPLGSTQLQLAFASGEPLARVRLCAGGALVPPVAVATGAAAGDTEPPTLAVTVVRRRVTLQASDAGAGVAGVWVAGTAARRYAGPFTVARGTKGRAWALDRAGNETARSFVVG